MVGENPVTGGQDGGGTAKEQEQKQARKFIGYVRESTYDTREWRN